MSELDKQEGAKLLAEQTAIFNEALAEAERIADVYGLEFSISPEYGMGGTYVGEKLVEEGDTWYESAGWMPSSQSC